MTDARFAALMLAVCGAIAYVISFGLLPTSPWDDFMATPEQQQRWITKKVGWLHSQGCVLRKVSLYGVGTFDCHGVIRDVGADVTKAWDGAEP